MKRVSPAICSNTSTGFPRPGSEGHIYWTPATGVENLTLRHTIAPRRPEIGLAEMAPLQHLVRQGIRVKSS